MTAAPQLDLDFARPRPRRNRVAFYNTTHLTGRDLRDAQSSAKKQDVLVLTIFRGCNRELTPSEVWRMGQANGSDWLLTSVRRSMHTLTRERLLVKCETYRIGPYKRPERTWKLRENTQV